MLRHTFRKCDKANFLFVVHNTFFPIFYFLKKTFIVTVSCEELRDSVIRIYVYSLPNAPPI